MPNAYTHAPALRPGLLKGSLQLLAWLLFHPAAWRSCAGRIAPNLSPGFALAELSVEQLRSRPVRRLLGRAFFIWTGGTAVAILLVSRLAGASWTAAVYGAALGVFLGWMLGLFLGTAVSLFLGIVTGWVGGVVLGLGGSLWAASPQGMAVHLVFGVGWGIMLGIISGLAAYTLLHGRARRVSIVPWVRQFKAILAGSAASILLIIAMFAIVSVAVAREQQTGLSIRLAASPYLISILALAGLTAVIFSAIIAWRTQSWRRGLLLGASMGTAYGLILVFLLRSATIDYIAFVLPSGRLLAELTGGAAFYSFISVIMTALYAALLALSHTLLERLAGEWAGAAAGFIAAAGIHLALRYLISLYHLWPNLLVSLLLIGLGFTLARWRPWLTWPLQRAWDYLLYQFDAERAPGDPVYLRRCAAFWDAQQRLPLRGLAQHLVLACRRQPQEADAAMTFLLDGPQRWAVSAARLELLAYRLETCRSVEDIRRVELPAGELDNPAGPILHRFRRFGRDVDAALRQVTGHHQRIALEGVLVGWEQFARDLTLSQEREAARFYPAARLWLNLAAAHLETLQAAIEASREIDNPYIFGAPISEEQEIFVGRRDIIARIEHHLLDIRRPPLLLYGQRRMGKTSLLRNLGRLFTSEIVPMFVDGQGVSLAADYADFLYGTARQMSRSAVRCRELTLPPLDRQTLLASPFTALDEWLDATEALMDEAGFRVALIAFDEIETLRRGMERGRFDEADILSFFRHVIQHRPRFKVLLASSHMLSEFPAHWAGYLINMQTVKISYLDEAAARDLVERPSPQFALHYEPEAVEHILRLTRGHPHLTQLLCHELVTLKNRQPPERRRLANTADVEAAAAQALAVGQLFFEDIARNQVDEDGRRLLHFLAKQGEEGVDTAVLAARLNNDPGKALAQLELRDLIEKTGSKYRFQVELIRRWFAIDN